MKLIGLRDATRLTDGRLAHLIARVESGWRDSLIVPCGAAATRLCETPGIGHAAAAITISEIGIDVARFLATGTPGVLGEVHSRCQGIGQEKKDKRLNLA